MKGRGIRPPRLRYPAPRDGASSPTMNSRSNRLAAYGMRKILLTSSWILVTVLAIFLAYNLAFFRNIYPGVSISGFSLSGQTKAEAINYLTNIIPLSEKLALTYDSQSFEILLSEIDFSYDIDGSVEAAYSMGRSGNILADFYTRVVLSFKKTDLPLQVSLDKTKLNEHLSIIADSVSVTPTYPTARFIVGVVMVTKGSPGKKIDQGGLSIKIIENLASMDSSSISIPVTIVNPVLSEEEAASFKSRAENFIGKSIKLTFKDAVFSLYEDEIFQFLNPRNGYLNEAEVLANISFSLNKKPQNPVFVFEGKRVAEFSPAQDGVEVNTKKLANDISNTLEFFESSENTQATLEIPAKIIPPELTTDKVNSLGIKELLGQGTSFFKGSIASRIHNIGVASSKFNGSLISPGEIFSFNDALGDVSVYTGYKKAYIIKDGRTVLGDGGGVCQVSTTFFRAGLDAGLPIIERRAHSYRVSYYEQNSLPGLDATVYAPYTDLKIENNTPAHLLIQTKFDQKTATLVFEIYGTADGRIAKTTKSIVTNILPPPEDLYQDDPTLAEGTIKQIDYKAWGAKVFFDYEVEKRGEVVYQKTFYSNFRPWQAVFLRGTAPAPQ